MAILGATDVARVGAICQFGADMLGKRPQCRLHRHGLGTVVQRMQRKQPTRERLEHPRPDVGRLRLVSPASDASARNGANASAGWPTLPKLEWLRINGCKRPTCQRRPLSQETSSCRRSPTCPACLWVSTTNRLHIGTT